MTKDVILTGIRANNDIHIGNYFGAMLPMIDMAKTLSDSYAINMFIPDLHSFTTPVDFKGLKKAIFNNARLYAAAGLPLDNDSIFLYRQSYISAHSELAWILDCFTGMGEMERMTQFKDKSKKLSGDHIAVGLFNYPVLMAADILLYNAKYVPVGEDQTQHLEFTRDIAERINSKFGDVFVVPEPVKNQHAFFGKDQGLRIKDLIDPLKKMSKSDDTGKGVVFLTDEPNEVRKKIMSATTDNKAEINYDKLNQPGISNLIDILALIRQSKGVMDAHNETVRQFQGQTRYGDFKQVVAEELAQFIQNFQAALSVVDDIKLTEKLESSEQAAMRIANDTLRRVQTAIGLR